MISTCWNHWNEQFLLSSAFLLVLLLSSEEENRCCHSFLKVGTKKTYKNDLFFRTMYTVLLKALLLESLLFFGVEDVLLATTTNGGLSLQFFPKNIFCLLVTQISSAELEYMHRKSCWYRVILSWEIVNNQLIIM